jgi:4-coumarate--CoA ligase
MVTVKGYGLTESTAGCFRTESQEAINYIGSVGRLVAGSEAKIVDLATGVALPPSSQGEIWIRGQQVMKGNFSIFKFRGGSSYQHKVVHI